MFRARATKGDNLPTSAPAATSKAAHFSLALSYYLFFCFYRRVRFRINLFDKKKKKKNSRLDVISLIFKEKINNRNYYLDTVFVLYFSSEKFY